MSLEASAKGFDDAARRGLKDSEARSQLTTVDFDLSEGDGLSEFERDGKAAIARVRLTQDKNIQSFMAALNRKGLAGSLSTEGGATVITILKANASQLEEIYQGMGKHKKLMSLEFNDDETGGAPATVEMSCTLTKELSIRSARLQTVVEKAGTLGFTVRALDINKERTKIEISGPRNKFSQLAPLLNGDANPSAEPDYPVASEATVADLSTKGPKKKVAKPAASVSKTGETAKSLKDDLKSTPPVTTEPDRQSGGRFAWLSKLFTRKAKAAVPAKPKLKARPKK
jgi:hypothetical protein